MESKIRQSIIKTVFYFDIFDYPLDSEEIWKYLDTPQRISRAEFEKVVGNIKGPISKKGKWHFIKGREDIIKKRLTRKKEAKIKVPIVISASKFLSIFPTVLFIGVSGGLSMENADKYDDIDIFVVTKNNSIWVTRFFIVLFLKLIGKYRGRNDKGVVNKICLNMLVDEGSLPFDKNRQDLYTAHEISQMIPIFNRNKTYEKFIAANSWIKNYLPNSVDKKIFSSKYKTDNKENLFLKILNCFAKFPQLWYIRKHMTSETITDHILAFHPLDYKSVVMQTYKNRIKKYEQEI